MKICPILPHNLKIKVASKNSWCKYYKTKGVDYTLDKIASCGFCPEAFHVAYPYCLGLLYGADFGSGNSVVIKCPLPEGGIGMQIEALPIKNLIKKIYNKIKRVINFFGYPADYIDKIIMIKVIEKGKGCPYNFENLQTFEFNTENGCGICPASFDAVYPYLHGLFKGVTQHYPHKLPAAIAQCPDQKVNVVYELVDTDERGS